MMQNNDIILMINNHNDIHSKSNQLVKGFETARKGVQDSVFAFVWVDQRISTRKSVQE